ncbi:hypothetical protein OSB04_007619 [Centaurea solstitialis]|uniref:Auxin efflux carrier component n=1 Tax=Centaurea solstitialis TaxID=347529 RepID=A0AA38WSP1_9ASTR|nr:hypothetical protein OSB04_007619 [Centaurea solstitialis]
MISLHDAYHVVAAIVPLYVAMILAYISVKWLKLFTPQQCSGINKFVAKFSIPLLSFQVISKSNPYTMNLKLICADFLQKVVALIGLTIITYVRSNVHLNWVITGLSLSTFPNTLILGIPMLKAMYGDEAGALLAQIVVLQSLIWYNLLLFLFELSAAREANVMQPLEDHREAQQEQGVEELEEAKSRNPRTKVMLILLTVSKKLLINPNTHATLLGLAWGCISFRWDVKLPNIVEKSISILSDGGLGMAMFSLGLFMASQASLIACGTRMALLAMVLKFIVGPAIMVAPSLALGLRGVLFKIATIQAALPQGIVPFVFAKEYNVHPEILSTRNNTNIIQPNCSILIGLLVALPIALVYYLLVIELSDTIENVAVLIQEARNPVVMVQAYRLLVAEILIVNVDLTEVKRAGPLVEYKGIIEAGELEDGGNCQVAASCKTTAVAFTFVSSCEEMMKTKGSYPILICKYLPGFWLVIRKE